MKAKNKENVKKNPLSKGKKGGQSKHSHNSVDFIEEDYINPLETSPRIFENNLLR